MATSLVQIANYANKSNNVEKHAQETARRLGWTQLNSAAIRKCVVNLTFLGTGNTCDTHALGECFLQD